MIRERFRRIEKDCKGFGRIGKSLGRLGRIG